MLFLSAHLIKRNVITPPIHPGEVLREDVLPALNMPITQAAQKMGISRQSLHRILVGSHPVTPAMALRLGKFCGNGPNLWLKLQTAYDLWHIERAMRDDLAKIETVRVG